MAASYSDRSILHFNVADFAVAVERLADSTLRNKAMIIAPLQAARAEVYDMSEEAYGAGVRKGMALRQATRLCRGARIIQPRPDLYQKAMKRLLGEVQGYSPLVEHGRDDGHLFLDVTGTHRLFGPAQDIGLKVRRHINSQLGIRPIWTLASNKLVSKVASRLVKPVGEYIVGQGDEEAFLAPLPVLLLPGLGGRELQQLEDFQIRTIGQLAGLTHAQLQVPFGGRGEHLYAISRGIDGSRVEPGVAEVALTFDHIFADDSNDIHEVEALLGELVSRAGMMLRMRGQAARRIALWLRYADGGQAGRQISLSIGTDNDFTLTTLCRTLLRRAWQRRVRLRVCRLICDRLHRRSPQLPLFPEMRAQENRQEHLLRAFDAIRERHGQHLRVGGRQPNVAIKNCSAPVPC